MFDVKHKYLLLCLFNTHKISMLNSMFYPQTTCHEGKQNTQLLDWLFNSLTWSNPYIQALINWIYTYSGIRYLSAINKDSAQNGQAKQAYLSVSLDIINVNEKTMQEGIIIYYQPNINTEMFNGVNNIHKNIHVFN